MTSKAQSNKKRSGSRPTLTVVAGSKLKSKKPVTLADIAVSWEDGHGVTRTANGAVLAWALRRAARLSGNLNLQLLDVTTGTGPNLLQGLGSIIFPDAGEPIRDVDHDRRWFLSWALEEMGAQQYADQLADGEDASRFTVAVKGA